jgi:hypothetical protein
LGSGAPRWKETEKNSGCRSRSYSEKHHVACDQDWPLGDTRCHDRNAHAEHDPDQSAEQAQGGRFDQKLQHDIEAPRPDGHQETDRARVGSVTDTSSDRTGPDVAKSLRIGPLEISATSYTNALPEPTHAPAPNCSPVPGSNKQDQQEEAVTGCDHGQISRHPYIDFLVDRCIPPNLLAPRLDDLDLKTEKPALIKDILFFSSTVLRTQPEPRSDREKHGLVYRSSCWLGLQRSLIYGYRTAQPQL